MNRTVIKSSLKAALFASLSATLPTGFSGSALAAERVAESKALSPCLTKRGTRSQDCTAQRNANSGVSMDVDSLAAGPRRGSRRGTGYIAKNSDELAKSSSRFSRRHSQADPVIVGKL